MPTIIPTCNETLGFPARHDDHLFRGGPTDGEWINMEMALGMSEEEASNTQWRGTNEGHQMRTNYGWIEGGNGTNLSGFSGLPGGYREPGGIFNEAQFGTTWWSSTPKGSNGWYRHLFGGAGEVFRGGGGYPEWGYSVRCIQDSE